MLHPARARCAASAARRTPRRGRTPTPMQRPAATSAFSAWNPPTRSSRTWCACPFHSKRRSCPVASYRCAMMRSAASARGRRSEDRCPAASATCGMRGPSASSMLITAVPSSGRTRAKSCGLGVEIVRHRAVVVEVILAEIREPRRRRAAPRPAGAGRARGTRPPSPRCLIPASAISASARCSVMGSGVVWASGADEVALDARGPDG